MHIDNKKYENIEHFHLSQPCHLFHTNQQRTKSMNTSDQTGNNTPSRNAKIRKVLFCIISVFIIITVVMFSFQNEFDKGNDHDAIKIAALLPLTGKGSSAGENAEKALRLCIEEWNARGGILGKKVEIEFYDVKNSEPKEGVFIAQKIVSQRIKPSIVINVTSAVVLPCQPIFEKHKIIQISLAPSSQLFATNPKYVIRNYPSDDKACKKLVLELKKVFEISEIKVLYPNSEWGRSNFEAFSVEAKQNGIAVSHAESYDEDEISCRNNIVKCNLKHTDCLYVIGSQERLGRIVRQARDFGFTGNIFGGADLITKSALDIIGYQRANMYYCTIEKSDNVALLMKKFEEKYDTRIDEMSLFFYNGLDLVLNAFLSKNTTDNDVLMSKINGFSHQSYLGEFKVKNNEISYEFSVKKLEDFK